MSSRCIGAEPGSAEIRAGARQLRDRQVAARDLRGGEKRSGRGLRLPPDQLDERRASSRRPGRLSPRGGRSRAPLSASGGRSSQSARCPRVPRLLGEWPDPLRGGAPACATARPAGSLGDGPDARRDHTSRPSDPLQHAARFCLSSRAPSCRTCTNVTLRWPMQPRAVFYYDLGSPYAYLAAERVNALFVEAIGEPPEWQPILLGGLFKRFGRDSWAETPDRDEGIAEVERRAAEYGLPPIRWPDPFPGNTLVAMRAATYAKEIGAHRLLLARGLPPGLRGGSRPERPRQRRDRRCGRRASSAGPDAGGRADPSRIGSARRPSAPAISACAACRPSSSATRSSGATTASRTPPQRPSERDVSPGHRRLGTFVLGGFRRTSALGGMEERGTSRRGVPRPRGAAASAGAPPRYRARRWRRSARRPRSGRVRRQGRRSARRRRLPRAARDDGADPALRGGGRAPVPTGQGRRIPPPGDRRGGDDRRHHVGDARPTTT